MSSNARFFRPSVPEGFEWALPTDPDYEVFRLLSDPPTAGAWKPIRMTLLKVDDHGRPHRHAYLPWLNSAVLILRDDAVEVIGALLKPHGELLPLACSQARLAVFSAPKIPGVLDEKRSDIVRFSSGRIMDLRAAAFREELLGQTRAFKLAEMPRGNLYLDGNLVDEIRATGMASGTTFAEVHPA